MNALKELLGKDYGSRTPLEQCISDACTLADQRDGDYALMEKAAAELSRLQEVKEAAQEAANRLQKLKDLSEEVAYQEDENGNVKVYIKLLWSQSDEEAHSALLAALERRP